MSLFDRLVRTAAPSVDALTVDDAKAHLRVTTAADDALIGGYIKAAIGAIDGPRGIGICLVEQTWRLTLDRFEPCIQIPLGPNVALTAVKYDDAAGVEQTLAADTDYRFCGDMEPAVLEPAFGKAWPVTRQQRGAVRIDFTVGFGPTADDVPADLVGALKLIVGHLYANREAVVAGDRAVAVDLPRGVDAVLDRYRAGLVA